MEEDEDEERLLDVVLNWGAGRCLAAASRLVNSKLR